MLIIKKLSFTLIEILIVLSIIAGVASVVGINMQKAFRDQRFKTEVALFIDHLRLAQDLMLITDADVHFKIEASETEKNVKYWIETDKSFSQSFDKFIKSSRFLKTVNHVAHASGKDGVIDLHFLSKGTSISSGNIQLSSVLKNDVSSALIANIMLKGYPSPIVSTELKKNEDSNTTTNSDMELIQATILEIQTVNNEKNTNNTIQ